MRSGEEVNLDSCAECHTGVMDDGTVGCARPLTRIDALRNGREIGEWFL